MIEESGPSGISDEREVVELWTNLRREIRRRGVDPETADDLAQETWLRTLRAPPERDGRGLGGWLHVVGVRLVSEFRRSSRNRVARERHVARGEEVRDEDEGESRIQQLVAELPSPYREVVYLRFYEGLGLTEIAQRLGRPPVTVRSQLARGLQRLRVRLGEEDRRWSHALLAFLGLRGGAKLAPRLAAAGGVLGLGLLLWFFLARDEQPIHAADTLAGIGAPLAALDGERSARELAPPPRGDEAPQVATPSARATRGLAGTVRTHDGRPVAGAALQLGPRSGAGRTVGVSDAAGRFALQDLEPEAFLWAESEGALPSRRLYLASLPAGAAHDFFLPADLGPLEVRLVDAAGLPAAGHEVVLDDEVGRAEQCVVTASGGLELVPHATLRAVTDSAGRALFRHPQRALIEFRVRAGGVLRFHDALELDPDQDRIELRLPRPPRLVGQLLGPDGAALGATPMIVRQRNDQVLLHVQTDARGRFAVDDLVPGEVTLQAMLSTSGSALNWLAQLAEGEVRDVVLQADASQAIVGVAREGARPLAGAEVALFREGRHGLDADHVVRCDEDGSFVLSALEGVDYWLELRRPGTPWPVGLARHVRVGERHELLVDPALEARQELVLRFATARPELLPARIKLRSAYPRLAVEAEVGADGRATLTLPQGEYDLAAWVPGVGYWRSTERFVPGGPVREVLVPAPGRVEVVLDLPPGPAARVALRVGGFNPFGYESLGAVSTDVLLESDASGRFFAGEVFPGKVSYLTQVDGHTDGFGRVHVVSGDRVEVRLAPRPARRLSLTLELPRPLSAGEGLVLEAVTPEGPFELATGAEALLGGTSLAFVLRTPLETSELRARTSLGLEGAVTLSPEHFAAGRAVPILLR